MGEGLGLGLGLPSRLGDSVALGSAELLFAASLWEASASRFSLSVGLRSSHSWSLMPVCMGPVHPGVPSL